MEPAFEQRLAFAERLVIKGDYRQARQIARAVKTAPDVTDAQSNRATKILDMTGRDPFAMLILGITFGLWLLLTFKYLL